MPKHDVLISYSREDQALAERVLRTLASRNIRCWAAFQDLEAGQFWPGAITEAIGDCSIFLLVLTKHSNTSRQVIRELTQADTLNKRLYCIQTEDIPISPNVQYFFSAVQRYEAFQVNLDTSLAKMSDDIARQLQRLDDTERPIAQAPPPALSAKSASGRGRMIGIASVVAVGLAVTAFVVLEMRTSDSRAGDTSSIASAPAETVKAADAPDVGETSRSGSPDPVRDENTTSGSKVADPPLPSKTTPKAVDVPPLGKSRSVTEVTRAVPRTRQVEGAEFTLSISRENFYVSKEFQIEDLDLQRDFIIGFDVKSTRSGGSTRYGIAWNFQPDDFFLFTIHSTNFGYYSIGPGRSLSSQPFARLSQGNIDINAERGFDHLEMERRGGDLLHCRRNRQRSATTRKSHPPRSHRAHCWCSGGIAWRP
jgi:hypothetical protein